MDLSIVKTGANSVLTINDVVTITVTHAKVPVIAVVPAAPTVPDNAPAGTNIAKVTVTNSDGSPYTGTLSISTQSIASEFVLAREGTTNVWDLNVGTLVVGAATPTIVLTAVE